MSIETAAYAALKGLVPLSGGAGKVYPDLNDAGTAAPYIVYARAGGDTAALLENALPSKDTARLQVTCWHTTRLAANALREQALAALVALGWRPIGGQVSLHDPTTNLRGAAQDFYAFADR